MKFVANKKDYKGRKNINYGNNPNNSNNNLNNNNIQPQQQNEISPMNLEENF
jgi:hypothetical protein